MHPPFPSVVNPEEHLGEDFILIGVFVEGIIGTHPPWSSVSHPSAQEIS
jgi:hypothetical protein